MSLKRIFRFFRRHLFPCLSIALLLALLLCLPLLLKFAIKLACHKQNIEFGVVACRLALPGRCSLKHASFSQPGCFKLSATGIELHCPLGKLLRGRPQLRDVVLHGAELQYRQEENDLYCEFVDLKMQINQLAPEKDGSLKLNGKLKSLVCRNQHYICDADWQLQCDFELDKKMQPQKLCGVWQLHEAVMDTLDGPIPIAGSLNFALKREAQDAWSMPAKGDESSGTNCLILQSKEKTLLDLQFKSGSYGKSGEEQYFQLELESQAVASDPLLGLLAPVAQEWVGAELQYLDLLLESRGINQDELLHNLNGVAVFDISWLRLKDSPYIRFFSVKTGLDLPDFLTFQQGSGIVKIEKQKCKITCSTPFRNQYALVGANGNIGMDGSLLLKVNLGFGKELEDMLKQKSYFKPFMAACRKQDDLLFLPAHLTLGGSLQAPSVELSDFLKAAAKAGVKNILEDSGRWRLRLQRSILRDD